MRVSLHKKDDAEKLIVSPITGNQIECAIRAFCANCGCLISHSSVAAVQKALSGYEKCRKCSCIEVSIKYVAVEDIVPARVI